MPLWGIVTERPGAGVCVEERPWWALLGERF